MEENKFLKNYKEKVSAQEHAQAQEPALPAGWQEISQAGDKGQKAIALQTSPKRNKLVGIVAAVLLVAGLAVLLLFLLGRGVTVIDLQGWQLSDVRLWADDAGLRLKIDEAYNDVYAAQQVVSQQPQPGAQLKKKDFLAVTVSLGHDLSVSLPIPAFEEMTLPELEAWVKENFMTRVRIVTEYSTLVDAGRVIRYEINDETVFESIRRDTPVYVLVSKGKEPEEQVLVNVPDFIGLSLPEARMLAKAEKLELDTADAYDDDVPEGLVISQDQDAESEVFQGSRILLTVSAGKKILVPDFSGLSQAGALAEAAELGMAVTVDERYAQQPVAALVSQSLSPGSIYQHGAVLELVYSLGNKLLLPDFTGQPRSSLELWAEEVNEQGACIKLGFGQTQSNLSPGSILYQNKKNVYVPIDASVQATVSLGRLIYVPDFVAPAGSGYDRAVTREQALAACEETGLIPVFVAEKTNDRLPGEVWSQSLSAGKEAYENTVITLKYQPAGVIYTVPDFAGKTEDVLLAAGYLKQFNLVFSTVLEEGSGTPGTVIRQSLAPGTTVAAGSTINLEVLAMFDVGWEDEPGLED